MWDDKCSSPNENAVCIGNLIQAKAIVVCRDPLHAGAIHVESVGDYHACHCSGRKKWSEDVSNIPSDSFSFELKSSLEIWAWYSLF
jgi:hypothetical protein